MTEMRLYVVQRVTAVAMVPFILLHIAVIFYAISHNFTARRNTGTDGRKHRMGSVLRRLRSARLGAWRHWAA